MFGHNSIVGAKFFKEAPKDQLLVTSRFYTLQGEGPFRGMPAFFIRLAKCNLACSFCFIPSTKILLSTGKQKKIKDIKIGDMVMSWNGEGFEPKKVIQTYKSEADSLVKIEIDCISSTWCTPNHPFLVSGRGWVDAKDLNPGDVLVHYNSSSRMKKFNPMFDPANRREMTVEQKKSASDRLSKLWKDPEFREKNVQRLKDHNPMKDPIIALKSFMNRENQLKSKLEEKIEQICAGLGIEFVGNGEMSIAHKVPDFVVLGQKKVIEIWPDDALWVRNKPRDKKWMDKRRALFAKHGYETLFLPLIQSDLKIDNHKNIREKVAQFIHNGNVVQKVTNVIDGRAFARIYGTKAAKRYVYNLEIEDTHTYVANNLVVHNCDTYFDSGTWKTYDQLFEESAHEITAFYARRNVEVPAWAIAHPKRKVVLVITGGEPSLQDNLVPFLEQAKQYFSEVQIESNGIRVLENLPEHVTLVVSPKCLEKSDIAVKYLEPNKDMLARADCLKFVMCSPDTAQFTPYAEVPKWAHDWAATTGKPIFVSPMNVYLREPKKAKELRAAKQLTEITIEERSMVDETISFWEEGLLDMKKNQINHEYTADYAMRHGFLFNMQIHLFASLP